MTKLIHSFLKKGAGLALLCLLPAAGNLMAQEVTDPSVSLPGYDAIKAQQSNLMRTATPANKYKDVTINSNARMASSGIASLPASSEMFTFSTCFIPRDASYTVLPRNDDGSYGPIALPFTFDLYGSSYTQVWINTNGNLTFTGSYSAYSASGFPFNMPMVAPFWADVDTRLGGQIYYKLNSTNLIVTWDGVGYYSGQTDKLNTFQAIIGTNADALTGLGQNVSLRYNDMQWTTGSASGGSGGFLGTAATVGVNQGNNTDYVQIGRFNQNNANYDGPGGANDGINYLDGQCYSFNVSNSGNIPPSANGLPANSELNLTCGQTVTISPQFLAPEVNQSVTLSVNTGGLCNTTVSSTNGTTATANVTITATACNTGTHQIVFTATDNGNPAETTTSVVTVNIGSCCNLQATASATNVACSGAATGSIDLSVSNFAAPLSFSWSNGATTEDLSDLAAGTYTVTVTDANGCTATTNATVGTDPDNTPPTVSCQNIIVQLDASGEATITPADLQPVGSGSETFNYTGSVQTFTVPAGVTSVNIEAWGAQGGNSLSCTSTTTNPDDDGGLGGFAAGFLTVTPGEELKIFVGDKPLVTAGEYYGMGVPGGYNGGGAGGHWGGGGGGAADVRQNGILLSNRVLVAGGGGGGNTGCPDYGAGGSGGGFFGLNGVSNSFSPGLGGSQFAGGGAGTNGMPGTLGAGGSSPDYHMAGGGGGYYGGGSAYAAGGGGGSSYIGGVTNGITSAGVNLGNGKVIISWTTPPAISDNCGIQSQTLSQSTFTCANLGENTITLTVTDVSGNVATCTAVVTVLDDINPCNEPPVAVCQNITVSTDANCVAVVTANDVDNGSSDPDGDTLSYSISPAGPFAVGIHTVTLTVTDPSGESDQCQATITVGDNTPPTVLTQNIAIQLDANGQASTSATEVNNGSSDACGIATLSLSQTNFNCANLGANSVVLIVTDNNGNTSSASATITVEDNISPTIACASNLSITALPNDCTPVVSWEEPVAADNCSYTVTSSHNSGDRFPVGTTTVTYTVTDAAGNSASCSFTVTVTPTPVVMNLASPTFAGGFNISCNSGNSGSATATVDGGCMPYSYVWSNGQTTATATNLTAGTYSVTVTDANGTSVTQSIALTEPTQLTVSGGIAPAQAYSTSQINTIYLGFGPQSRTLSATATGGVTGYSYDWSPVTGLNTTSGPSVEASPQVSTVYEVTVTDANGCMATNSYEIQVIDARCGNNQNNPKVLICHNGNEICSSPNAVLAHLAHGCQLGPCTSTARITENATVTEPALLVYPNPNNGLFTLEVKAFVAGQVIIDLFDVTGRSVGTLFNGTMEAGQHRDIPVNQTGLAGGIYMVRMQSAGQVTNLRVNIQP